MALKQEVDQVFNALVNSTRLRLVRYPPAMAGVNIVSDGAAIAGDYTANYIQVAAALIMVDPCWLCGLALGTPQVEAFYGDIKIAIGGIGVEIDLMEIPVGTDLFPVVEWRHPITWLPKAIRVDASPRLAVNLRKSTGASLAGFNNCAILAWTGIGS